MSWRKGNQYFLGGVGDRQRSLDRADPGGEGKHHRGCLYWPDSECDLFVLQRTWQGFAEKIY